MPFIRNLWVATLTSNSSDAGTESETVFIMNQEGLDVVHRDMELFRSVATGGGSFTILDVAESQILPENYYLRIGIRGSDAWRPEVIVAWCERFTSGNIVPLGYEEQSDITLSTDASEGRISLPLRPVVPGVIRTEIQRVLLFTITHFSDFATDSPVHVRIRRGDELVVDHTIPDTPQPDFESGQGNLYFLPVLAPFTRSQLTDASVELSIEGDDAWRPIAVVMFGLNTASGNPGLVVPLVHVFPWTLGLLSTDPDEGAPSAVLPLAPIDP
ncbi:hypothetical protein [Methylocaldum sp.]|uniref:hypothetical protein n=1 Tax=Methylocaldum sp. TaxID=1969727 RepID=UPI002D66D754|nr:hypothetical protein [Methylocaldum sp.]HYE37529.1 hypothetical protein [Methylocaldum sp.]